jgi:hypothetical protein
MFVCDLLYYQTARRCFPAQTTYGHPTVRKAKLDGIFQSQGFVGMYVVVGGYRASHD